MMQKVDRKQLIELTSQKSIRTSFWAVIEEGNKDMGAHVEHRFDTLRQSILCHADNLPLYNFGDDTAGDGQMHQCRSWDVLKNYATENTVGLVVS